jgi:hypothetical protein
MPIAYHRHVLKAVGRCIYCGSTENLTDEHIVPYAIHGYYELPKSSCKKCAAEINKFEQRCTGSFFLPYRLGGKYRSRKTAKQNRTIKLAIGRSPENVEIADLQFSDFPKLICNAVFPLPGVIRGDDPNRELRGGVLIATTKAEHERLRKRFSMHPNFRMVFHTDGKALAKTLAKIAHGFAVDTFGIDTFRHRLPPLILGHPTEYGLSYFVGSDPRPTRPAPVMHAVDTKKLMIRGIRYCAVFIRLFANLNLQRHLVIVGEDLTNQSDVPQNNSQ